jgi:hypothetical protein
VVAGSGAPATIVDEAEARAFAERLAASVVPCDPTAITDRMASDGPVAARLFCEWMQGIASYKVVGVRHVGGQVHPITRRLIKDAATGAMFVNYDELALARTGNDTKLADAQSFRQGVWLTDLVASNGDSQGPTDYLGTAGKDPAVRAARDLLRTGDREGTLKALDALPPGVRNLRGVLLLRVRASVGTSSYKAALDELAKTFPDDPVIALTMMDGCLDISDYDQAMHWIDVLENAIGVDAYLESMRAIALVRKGDFDKGLQVINAAIELEPTLTRPLEIKLDILIVKKQWPDVLATMTQLEDEHDENFDVTKLMKEPRLAELVQSPAFTEWLRTRGH